MIWQKYGVMQRGEGRWTEKSNKKWCRERSCSQKSDTTHLKKEIVRVTCILNDPYDADLFCRIFYECI